mgnify:CR=1 FL=1
MQKKKYETPRLENVYTLLDVVRTSDLYAVDGYDPDEWQDTESQS